MSSARNSALDVMTGEYLYFLDSDDWLEPYAVKRLYGLIVAYDADIVVAGYQTNDEIKILYGNELLAMVSLPRKIHLFPLKKKSYLNLGIVMNKLYKAKIFEELRFIEGIIHEDIAICHRVFGSCSISVVSYWSKKAYHYNSGRPGSIMTNIRALKVNEEHLRDVASFYGLKRAFDDRYEYLKSIGLDDFAEMSYLYFSIYNLHSYILRKVNYLQYRDKIAEFTGITSVQAVIKLLCTKNFRIKIQGVKLALRILKNIIAGRNQKE